MVKSALRPRWRRGIGTLLGLPTMPVRKLLRYDLTELSDPSRQAHGLTVVLSGIEGRGPFSASLARGLATGWNGAVEVFEWTSRRIFATLKHLSDERRNREQACLIADRIQEYWESHPEAPVHLAGHSGGAAIAVFTMEELLERKERRRIGRALLLGAALSHTYDLGLALRQAEEVHAFQSRLDIPHLVLGTLVFGTMDRRHAVSAGFNGFQVVDDPIYDRLCQHSYQSQMMRSWHFGGHMGWTNEVFAAEHLAPLLA